MKGIQTMIYKTLLWFPILMMACQEDYMETNLGDNPLNLTVDNAVVELDITSPQSNAIAFEWTPGSNFNTNAAIHYLFEIGLEGTNFENGLLIEMNQGKRSVSMKTQELNELLRSQFGVTGKQVVTLEARVTAKIPKGNLPVQYSKIVKVKVTSYLPVSQTLYLIGSATPNGWSADNATKMNTVSGSAGGFVWQGKLFAGEMKLITTLGMFTPSYNKGNEDSQLYFRESDEDPYDEKFIIPTTGIYKISVNLLNLTISIEALDAPEFANLWFVGNATGWGFKEMEIDAIDPFVFHYKADLSVGGEFKIATKPDFDPSVIFLRPEINGQGVGVDLNVEKWSESENPSDHKWNIPGGIYKIRLDTREMKINIVPFTPFPMIYIVGSAAPNGWDINNATPLTAGSSENKFVWTGNLSSGEMKFSCDKKSDWNGAWFLANQNSKEPTGELESMIFSPVGSNPDNKWNISEPGIYSIELDQLLETVTIKKQ
ncbi:MAG: SusF/SusE family outer membrane protein [Breznakibacter sp.]